MKDEEKKTDSDDDYIGGKVFVEDEKIRVEGESNLAEGQLYRWKCTGIPLHEDGFLWNMS